MADIPREASYIQRYSQKHAQNWIFGHQKQYMRFM